MSLWLFALALVFPFPDDSEKIIENGLAPKGKVQTIVFKEDLRFGADEEGEEYLWPSITVSLAVDDEGQILIADTKSNEIRIFDAKGKYVRSLAKAGPGPGELQAVNHIQFLKDGSLAVFEAKAMFQSQTQIFDKKGTYVTTKKVQSFANMPITALFSPDGKYYGGSYMSVDPQGGTLITKTGLGDANTYAPIKEYSSFGIKVDFSQMGNPGTFADMMGDMVTGYLKGAGVFVWDAQGNMYSAMTSKYEITKFAPDMSKKLMTIRREYKPTLSTDQEKRAVVDKIADGFRESPFARMVTDEFITRMLDKVDFPPNNLPVESLGMTPEGYLLVLHGSSTVTGKQNADIFDPKGQYIGNVSLPDWSFAGPNYQFRMVFKKGYAYAIQTDEEGDNRLVRFKYNLAAK